MRPALVTFRTDLHHPVQTYQPLHVSTPLARCIIHLRLLRRLQARLYYWSCRHDLMFSVSYPGIIRWQLKSLVPSTLTAVEVKGVARGCEEISGRSAQVDNNNNNHQLHGASQRFQSKCALPQL